MNEDKICVSITRLRLTGAQVRALDEMNLDDTRSVKELRALLRAGALDSHNTLKLIAKLSAKGIKPSREALDGLAKAVREYFARA